MIVDGKAMGPLSCTQIHWTAARDARKSARPLWLEPYATRAAMATAGCFAIFTDRASGV